MPLVYEDLRRVARNFLARERQDHTLQPTALVNETYLRLVDQNRVEWQDRAQFFAIAARLMRRILVDHARRRQAKKRVTIVPPPDPDAGLATDQRQVDILTLDRALDQLSALEPRKVEVAILRFIGGLTVEETASVLGVSPRTVKSDWKLARTWLYGRLNY